MDQKSTGSNNISQAPGVVVSRPVIEYELPNPPQEQVAIAYRDLLKNALAALGFALLVSMPFVGVLMVIGFSHFDVPEDAATASLTSLVGNIGAVVTVLAGGIFFAKKTKLISGFFAFILACFAAAVPAIALPYMIDSEKIGGAITVPVTIITFAIFTLLLTKLAMSRFKMITITLIAVPITLVLVFTNNYYSVHGKAIKNQQSVKNSLGGVMKLDYQFYAPISGEWTFHYVSAYAGDYFSKDHQILDIQMDGDTGTETYLQVDEGTNKDDVLNVNSNPHDCSIKSFSKTRLGRPVYADSCPNFPQEGYNWAATKLGNVYITLQLRASGDDSRALSYYSAIIDSLSPISKTQLSQKLLHNRT